MVDPLVPADATTLYRRGAECLARGDAAGAARHLERAVEITPDYAWAHHNLGQAYRALRKTAAAERALRRAVQLDPAYAIAFANLGTFLAEAGRFAEAVEALARARELATDSVPIQESYIAAVERLAENLSRSADFGGAFAAYRLLFREPVAKDRYLPSLAALLPWVRFIAVDAGIFGDLEYILASPFTDPRRAAGAIASALHHHSVIKPLLGAEVDLQSAAQLARVPLLTATMCLAALPDLELEKLLTRVRRRLLESVDQIAPDSDTFRFAIALARLGFVNEYVFAETPGETQGVDKLVEAVARAVSAGEQPSVASVILLASYRPLGEFAWADGLLAHSWPDDVQAVMRQQIVEPREETEHRARIPQLTAINDEISKAVRAQYERNPYPRWTRIATAARPQSIEDHCRQWCRGVVLKVAEDPEILVAGCGTGRQALYAATSYRASRILAIDLSLPSLGYSARKAQEFGIRNLEFGQADLLRVSELGRRFDFIESIGVLHHLANPASGLRALAEVLRPGGVMRLGLYSARERRRWFEKVRALLGRHGLALPASAEEIRGARQLIVAEATGPTADPDLAALVGYADFFGLSECRDLAFHVQEHSFEVEGLGALLEASGLDFIGFESQVNGAAIRAFRRLHGPNASLGDLALWRAVEEGEIAPILFRFICRKVA